MKYTIAKNITSNNFTIAIGEMIMQTKTLVELLKIFQANNLGIACGGDDQDVDLYSCKLVVFAYDKQTDWWDIRGNTTIDFTFYPFDHVVEVHVTDGKSDYTHTVTF